MAENNESSSIPTQEENSVRNNLMFMSYRYQEQKRLRNYLQGKFVKFNLDPFFSSWFHLTSQKKYSCL